MKGAPRTTLSTDSTPAAADIERCRRCGLWRHATHGVAGAGPAHPRLMLVGEQPGDQEDRVGQPFVGPAGRELDRLLARAGVDRASAYVTNAVKHFKWEPRGKRRLHRGPNAEEIDACYPMARHSPSTGSKTDPMIIVRHRTSTHDTAALSMRQRTQGSARRA